MTMPKSTSSPLQTILALTPKAKQSGNQWSAPCPAHDDQHASLSISEGADGKVLLFCHAGCDLLAIVKAYGVEEGDLFPPKDGEGRRVVAEYSYCDEDGKELFQAVRFAPKEFRQRHKEGNFWIWNLTGVRRVPYRLPELIEGIKNKVTVYVVEGERDVEAMRSLGLTATCNPMGAGKWRPEYSKYFSDAHIVIIADKDAAGKKHAEMVATFLGKATIVEVPTGKDASDWIAAGATKADFGNLAPAALAVISKWSDKLLWRTGPGGQATTLRDHISNVTLILTHDERWVGCLSLNEFSQIDEFVKRPPHEPGTEAWLPRPMNDADFTFITNWLAAQYGLFVAPVVVLQAAKAVSHRNSHHPVRTYLDSLSWDGVERLSSWLEDFTGATSTTGSANYIRSVARAWMISAVARIYQPGCKADHVLILEGMTGIKKSTAFSVLGGEWFTDQVASLDTKDSNLGVQGVWIIELAELDVMSRHEVGRIKAFLTVTSDRVRPPYGHVVMHYDRQCVFAGTVNHTDYLKDETGNSRFWPVRCTNSQININALAESRDQLWAEAVMAYRAGEKWWLEDEHAAREEQEDRMAVDAWEEPIGRHLSTVKQEWGPLLRERPHVTVSEILKVLQIPIERQGLAEQRRIVSSLKRFRWDRRRVRVDHGGREYWYMAPEE
jgi:predicted P-loop ATPase/5S rRNA maturation endonuclease (ribonuclease M5)